VALRVCVRVRQSQKRLWKPPVKVFAHLLSDVFARLVYNLHFSGREREIQNILLDNWQKKVTNQQDFATKESNTLIELVQFGERKQESKSGYHQRSC
jgi:hypothetical protein